MEVVIVNAGCCDASLGLAEALDQLSEFPVAGGSVLCLGIRLEGFSVADWQAVRTWLNKAGLVSFSELAKASRFLHVEDAVRHLLARSLLRSVLTRQGGGRCLTSGLSMPGVNLMVLRGACISI